MSTYKKSEDLYRPIKKEGTHLASSKDTDGAYRGALLSDKSNQVVGQAEWVRVNADSQSQEKVVQNKKYMVDQELTQGQERIAKMIGEVVAAGTIYIMREYVAPNIKMWWYNTALPKLKSNKNLMGNKKIQSNNLKQEESVNVNTDNNIMTMLLDEINEVHEKYKNTMSKEEYQNEVLDVFIISSLLVKKLRKLSEIKIIDGEISVNDLQKEKEVIQKLTSPDFIYIINQILMKNPAVLVREEKILSELAGYSIIVDNNFIPLESSQYKRRLIGM